jgi:hypothetical protein
LVTERDETGGGHGTRLAKVGTTLSGIVVVLFLIAIWAMTTKPL